MSSRRGWVLGASVASFSLAVVAVAVAVKWVSNPVGGPVPMPHQPGTKGVVSGTLVLVGGLGGHPAMTPVPGRISVGNIYQVGPITYVATVGPNGQFSVSVNPGVYEVTGVSPQYVGGRQSCAIAGQTVRVRSGDRVNVSVECQIR